MGTRSLTHFEQDGEILCTLYRQSDGYPSGQGEELAAFLSGFKIVNGIGNEEKSFDKLANGLGCLAAQVISHFKTDTRCYQRRNEMSRRMSESMKEKGSPFAYDHEDYPDRDFRVGSFYIYPAGASGVWEDYTYTVYVAEEETKDDRGKPLLRVKMRCETDMKDESFVLFNDYPENWDTTEVEAITEKASAAAYGKDK